MYHYTIRKTVILRYGFDSDAEYGSDDLDAEIDNILLTVPNSYYDFVDEDYEVMEY